jgi:hypothetical protein
MENYQIKMKNIIKELNGKKSLLIHSCCAPCSSYPLEVLSKDFDITLFYFNPNITDYNEYKKRKTELHKYVNETNSTIKIIEGNYNTNDFYEAIKGFEHIKEGGERCFKCYELRLRETAKIAKALNFDYFTTALSISPYKNSLKINEFGEKLEKEYGIKFLYADFKKNNGYKRSIELSNIHGLYRQDYCGCDFSKKEHEQATNKKQEK